MLKLFLLCCLIGISHVAAAHDDHDQLAISVVFDAQGQLWRAAVKDGQVLVDRSTDLGKTFSAAIRVKAGQSHGSAVGDRHPKLAIGPEGNIYLAWTQSLSEPDMGYLWFSRSIDGGKNFSVPIILHQGHAEVEALSVAATGLVYVAWLAQGSGKKTDESAAVFYAVSEDAGETFQAEHRLVDSVCECSHIALVAEPDGHAVAMWRQFFDSGVSDHAIARLGGVAEVGLSARPEIHRASFGGMKMDACPSTGSALARGVQGGQQWGWHMAWLNDGEKPGLFYARMDSEAWVSSPAKRISNALRLTGYPDLLSQDEHVWLTWKEHADNVSVIKLAVSTDGGRSWDEALQLAQTADKSDYPLLLEHAGQVYLGWNTQAEGFLLISLKVAK